MPDFTTHMVPICSTNVYWGKEVTGSKGDKYLVRFEKLPQSADVQYGYTCTCKGYEFRHTCKHIESAKRERCGWNGELEPTAKAPNNTCPKCKESVVYIKVAV